MRITQIFGRLHVAMLGASTMTFRDDWELVCRLAEEPSQSGTRYRLRLPDSEPCEVIIDSRCRRGWRAEGKLPAETRRLFDVFVPLCGPGTRRLTIAQLGQSIDGFIAGADGESRTLNGRQGIVHLHRLRAVCDAVVVGRHTASTDDPKLTTRLVPGENPARVVLDAQLRCEPSLEMFNDGAAPTFVICAASAPQRSFPGTTKVLRLGDAKCSMRAAVERLHAEGLQRIFIEGGGSTVSASLKEGVLDRLHVAVAPIVIGSGVRGLSLSHITCFAEALRPTCQHFPLGRDVLFDFEWSR